MLTFNVPLQIPNPLFDLAGIFNTLIADPVKALLKEDYLPKGTSQFMHSLAPFLAVLPIILCFAPVPFGPPLILGGREISLELSELNSGVLYVFAMGSLSIYGSLLAGWVSNNKFSLLGSLRAAAQLLSYEVCMGISIVGLLAIYQTLNLTEIVAMQQGTVFGILPRWGIFLSPFSWLALIVFFTSVMAETKRAPFDLPESESEIVAGYFTEYSGMKFLLFWFGEFAEIVVASTLVAILFFGGWQLPFVNIAEWPLGSLIGAAVFGAKVSLLCLLQIVIRWTLPRFRFDQLMNLCWKRLLPIAIVNTIIMVGLHLWLR